MPGRFLRNFRATSIHDWACALLRGAAWLTALTQGGGVSTGNVERSVSSKNGILISSEAWEGLQGAYNLQVHRSEEHTSELQSPCNLVCRLLLEKKKNNYLSTKTDFAP